MPRSTPFVWLLAALFMCAPAVAQPSFVEVSKTLGFSLEDDYLSSTNHNLGLLWIDVDGNGWDDLFVVNGYDGQPHLYRNTGGTFVLRDNALPPLPNVEIAGAAFADYDNDGDMDIYLQITNEQFNLMGANELDGPVNILLQNRRIPDGQETLPLFVDVAAAAGVDNVAPVSMHGDYTGYRSMTGGWIDYDLDGCVDLYVGTFNPEGGGTQSHLDTFYRNNCDGTFTDITTAAGLNHIGDPNTLRPTLAWIGARLDGDRWPDMFVVNVMYPSPTYVLDNLYLNNGDGTFRDIVSGLPNTMGNDTGAGMGIDVADTDLDGDWDIYITDLENNMFEHTTDNWRQINAFYASNGDGTWADDTGEALGIEAGFSWGTNFFDADNDGDEDLFVVGHNNKWLYQNNGDGTWTDISAAAGFGSQPDALSKGSAVADFDHDGDLDLAVINSPLKEGGVITVPGFLELYENQTIDGGTVPASANFLVLTLEGIESNRAAINALVRARVGSTTMMRQIKGGSSAHSQDMLSVHFGLGAATIVDELVIEWPSGITQTMLDVPAGRMTVVEESELPVELAGFDAQVDGRDVRLSWETLSQAPGAQFEVQHQRAGRFVTIGTVLGDEKPGHYAYTARGIEPGRHLFRLRHHEHGGSVRYSPLVEAFVELAGVYELSSAYPNPFNPEATFTLTVHDAQDVRIGLYDVLGRRVASLFDGTVPANQAQTMRIDGAGLPSGLYVVRVVGERFTAAQTVLLAK